MKKIIASILLVISFSSLSQVLKLSELSENDNITSKIYLLQTFEEDFNRIKELDFKAHKKEHVKIPYTNKYIWMKLSVENDSSEDILKYLVIDSTLTGEVTVFEEIDGVIVNETFSGSALEWNKRLVKDFYATFPITFNKGSEKTIYIKRKSHHTLDAHIKLIGAEAYSKQVQTNSTVMAIYLGIIIGLAIYNFFLYFFTKNVIYVYYSMFSLSVLGTALSMNGYLDFLFPNTFPFSENLLIFSSLAMVTALNFSAHYINLKIYNKKLQNFMVVIGSLGILNLLIYLSPIHQITGSYNGVIVDLLIALACLSMLTGGVIATKKGNILARFYLLSWIFVFLGVFLYFGSTFGLFPRNDFFRYGIMWGNACEMLIVAIGLSYQISILEMEKRTAQIQALGREKYKRLVRVLIHDVGNPLSLISYYVKKWIVDPSQFEDSTKRSKTLNKLLRGVTNIEALLKSVREEELLFKNSGKISNMAVIDVKECINESCEVLENKIHSKNIYIERNITDKDCFILADKVNFINNILNNIISNSIKFSDESSKIIIDCDVLNKKLYLSIKDFGVGIPREVISKFNSGEELQSHRGTMGEIGTGFGLQLMKSYVESFNGAVTISSNVRGETSDGMTEVSLIFSIVKRS
ncbi:MAG: sensor histidine kinase [Oligoflexia bacterium]|nr:sensor histidine kinase [Oligoflexia bacterium]